MQQNREHLTVLSEKLRKKINLLIVDDYPLIRNSLCEIFSSPLFNICIASSEKEARAIIPTLPVWHGWILDISMEENESGLSLLADYTQFPFAIMLSGIRSMHIASRAKELGAYRVYDKDPATHPKMHHDVCTMAALAYILKGCSTKYFSLFEILSRKTIKSTEEWARSACLTTRQLERISSTHFNITPRFILPFFYSLRFLLCFNSHAGQNENGIELWNEHNPAIEQHLAFVYRNINRFFPN